MAATCFLVPPVIPIAVIAAPFFLALSDPVSGLDDLNCWLFASTSHIRIDRGNVIWRLTTPDTSNQVWCSAASPMTTIAFWSGSVCRWSLTLGPSSRHRGCGWSH